MKTIGIIYNFKNSGPRDLAHALEGKLRGMKYACWVCSTNRMAEVEDLAGGADVLVSVGGDGTILRVAHIAVPLGAPILGVNMGRVGFMTELQGNQALDRVPWYLQSEVRMEERSTLAVEVISRETPESEKVRFFALNDVVVGRGVVARVANVQARVDGALLTDYRADAVIVATATGSTGYAMACGGPIMYPESREMIVVPVSPHLSLGNAVLVSPDSVVELRLLSDHSGMASVDGQIDQPLAAGDLVRARRSDKVARFLRAQPPSAFFASITERLRLRE